MANEDKAARYQRLRRRAALLGVAWRLALLAGLMLTGLSTAIRQVVEAAAGPGLVPLVPVYVLALVTLDELGQFPLAVYLGVVLERRYGLTHQRGTWWWADHVKAAAVSAVWLVAAGTVVVLLIRWSPAWWWLAATGCFAAVLMLVAQFAPVVLLPLFYDVRPLADQGLRERLIALADRAGTPVLDVYEWKIGARTRRANAALVGIGPTRRILLSDTLLGAHSEDEIEAVIAHELAHHVYGDVWPVMLLDTAVVAAGMYLADRLLDSYPALFHLDGKADPAGLPILVLASGAASLAFLPVANALSRAHERRADRFALDLTKNAAAFIRVMQRLAARNMAEERPSRIVEMLFHTHPAVGTRIDEARAWRGEGE